MRKSKDLIEVRREICNLIAHSKGMEKIKGQTQK